MGSLKHIITKPLVVINAPFKQSRHLLTANARSRYYVLWMLPWYLEFLNTKATKLQKFRWRIQRVDHTINVCSKGAKYCQCKCHDYIFNAYHVHIYLYLLPHLLSLSIANVTYYIYAFHNFVIATCYVMYLSYSYR